MERKKNTKLKILFIELFLAVSLVPVVLMPWFGNQEAESADSDVWLKPLMIDGKLNAAFFQDASGKFDTSFAEQTGDYFSKKFAFRRELVDLGDKIKAGIFGTSGQDGVVCGRNGYLFYKDSFNDFLGRDELSDYQIASMAYDLKLMQDELGSQDIRFLFTIAPNKNSLYPELMPKRYRPDTALRNAARLVPALKDLGVFYTDLYSLFEKQKTDADTSGVMYLKGDSHWNNKGAAMVTEKLMEALGREHEEFDKEHYIIRKDFNGDLYKMLYPASIVTDKQIYYDKMTASEYNKRVRISVIDDETGEMTETEMAKDPEWSYASEIKTESLTGKTGSLLMIRDSFGNSLAPFIADEFEEAEFLNGTPYDLSKAIDGDRDTVIFETVERNLDRLIQDAPVLTTSDLGIPEDVKPILEDLSSGISDYNGSVEMAPSDTEFDHTHVTGRLDPEKTENNIRPYLLMKNDDTGDTEYHALFRTDSIGDEEDADTTSAGEYGISCYIRSDKIENGSYSLFIAYEQNGNWNVSGKLGEYKN